MVRATEFMANWRVICRPIACFPLHCKGCVWLSVELTQPKLGRPTIGAVISFAFKLPSSPYAHSKFALLRTVQGCHATSIQLESEVISTQPSGKFTHGAVGFAGLFRPSPSSVPAFFVLASLLSSLGPIQFLILLGAA